MCNPNVTRFFIGTDSGLGFYSYLDAFYDGKTMRKVFLLKGGAGNGKSTLMKKLAWAAAEKGLHTEQIFCASDPMSLDAVLIPETQTAVIDATPPHVREIGCHGAPERYISLSGLVDLDAIRCQSEKLRELSGAVRNCHAEACKRLAAARSASDTAFGLILDGVDTARLARRGEALARRYLPKRSKRVPSIARKRFLAAFTPGGTTAFAETPTMLCGGAENAVCVALQDRFGLSPFVLAPLLEALERGGWEVYACYAPLTPSCLTAVIAPELSLIAAVDTHGIFANCSNVRNLRLNDAVAPDVLRQHRTRLRMLRHTQIALETDACNCLTEALQFHDALEAAYLPYLDRSGLDRVAEKLIEECIG